MFLSFIVPIYNVKDYLRECIDSLLNQDVDGYEIILVDDGSTDGSEKICDEYTEKFDKVSTVHKSNEGLADARNCGIRNASGEYIAFVDSDDFIEGNCLKKIIGELKEQQYPDIMFMRAYKYTSGKKLSFLDEDYDKTKITGCNRDEVITYIAGRKKYPGSACTKIVRRRLIEDNSIYFETGRLSEDLNWVKEILFAAQSFGYHDTPYYYYRQNRKGSITDSISAKIYFDRMYIYDSWIKELQNTESPTKKNALKSFLAYEYPIMIMDYGKLNSDDQRDVLEWLGHNKKLIKYKSNIKNKLIEMVLDCIGINNTSKLLNYYIKRSGER